MLYQQGLTELIHSSPSEQVAYLLVERASLLETSELTDKLTGDGNTANHMGTGAQVKSTGVSQVRGRTSQIQSHMANMHIVFLVCDGLQMLFHRLPTRGHHVMGRAHGKNSLDSSLHRTNILLFLYVCR